MSDKKISNLNELATALSGDLIPIVDSTTNETKFIQKGNLVTNSFTTELKTANFTAYPNKFYFVHSPGNTVIITPEAIANAKDGDRFLFFVLGGTIGEVPHGYGQNDPISAVTDEVVEYYASKGYNNRWTRIRYEKTTTTLLSELGLGNVDNTSDANKPISIEGMASNSTGVKTGGVLSIGTPITTFSISDGTGAVTVNHTGSPTHTPVSWTGKTNITATYIASGLVSYVAIDASGTVIQQLLPFTQTQSRSLILLGSLVHVNLTNLDAVNNFQDVILSPANMVHDLSHSIGIFNVNGNVFSANGANLNLNKSVGRAYAVGSNWAVNVLDPSNVTLGSLSALTFQYRFQNGTNGATGIAINPNIYDFAGVSTAVPTNKFTIQRIYSFVSNNVKIQPGQTIYNSLAEAKAAIQTEVFVTETSIANNGLLRGYLIVQEGTTSLTTATKAFFLEAPKFGGTAGVGGLSVSTLQNAYDNSTSPEILTDATRGALSVKRGSASDTDTIIEGLNNAGTVTSSIDGNGLIYSGQATASTPSFFNASKKLISMTGALLGTWFQTLAAKTAPVDADTIIVNDSASSFEAKKTTLSQFYAYLKSKIVSGLTSGAIIHYNGTDLVDSILSQASSNITNTGGYIAKGYTTPTVASGYMGYTGVSAEFVGYKTPLQFSAVSTLGTSAATLNVDNVPSINDYTDRTNGRISYSALGDHVFKCQRVGSEVEIARFVQKNTTEGELNLKTTTNKLTFGNVGGGNAYIDAINFRNTQPALNILNLVGGNWRGIEFNSSINCTQLFTDRYIAFCKQADFVAGTGISAANYLLTADFTNFSVGFGTTTPNVRAIIDMASTTKGFLPPRMTNAQMSPISQVAGLNAYQTDLVTGNKLFDGTNIRHINDSEGTYIKTGTNKTAGVATLVAGTVTVSTNKVTANSMIFLTRQTTAGVLGASVDITARTAGTSFTITSNGSILDTSTVAWQIVEPY